MENLWSVADEFKPSEEEPPVAILRQQANLLPKLIKDLVYAEVPEINELYYFVIKIRFVKSYSFLCLLFTHYSRSSVLSI